MYGKIFASMYEGSMVGAGPVVFAVWGYCIAKADMDGTVLLNPALLAPIIGTSRGDIESAIRYLQEPDGHSKNPAHEGRRLLHQTGHLFFLVSHEAYRSMKSNQDRRDYMREYMRERRQKEDVNSLQSLQELTEVNSASVSVNASLSPEGGCKGGKRGELIAFGEFGKVKLSKDEHAKLVAKHGSTKTNAGITELDAWIERTGKRRKNHYACLSEASWVWEKVAKDEPRGIGFMREDDA